MKDKKIENSINTFRGAFNVMAVSRDNRPARWHLSVFMDFGEDVESRSSRILREEATVPVFVYVFVLFHLLYRVTVLVTWLVTSWTL